MTQAIANLSDNVLATAAAKHLKASEGCGLNPNDVAGECIKVLSSSAVLVELVDRANAELSRRAEQAVQVAA